MDKIKEGILEKIKGFPGKPITGSEIPRPTRPLYYGNINYGQAFITHVGIKNTTQTITAPFRVWIQLMDYFDNKWRDYAYYGYTRDVSPQEEIDVAISKVVPDGYLIKIPAYSRMDWEGANRIRAIVWNGKELAVNDFDAFYAKPVGEFSVGIIQNCFCEGVDSNYNPINPKLTFKRDEPIYYYIKAYYDPRGFRFTVTWHWKDLLPWTACADAPPNQNWEWVAWYTYYNPPLPATGNLEVFFRVAGNDCVKHEATIIE